MALRSASRMRRSTSSSRPPEKSGRSDDHLGEHDAEREQIAPRVELAPDDLLGRHVAELAFELPGVRPPLELGGARDAEVGELHRAGAIDEHVAGRDVAVHERQRLAVLVARGVRVLEPAEDAERDVERHVERDVLAARGGCADQPRARRAVDVLHGHVELAVLLAEVEDLTRCSGARARAVTRASSTNIATKSGIARELRKDALDRDLLLEAVRPRASCEVHLRHPARGEPFDELVRPEPRGEVPLTVSLDRYHPSRISM